MCWNLDNPQFRILRNTGITCFHNGVVSGFIAMSGKVKHVSEIDFNMVFEIAHFVIISTIFRLAIIKHLLGWYLPTTDCFELVLNQILMPLKIDCLKMKTYYWFLDVISLDTLLSMKEACF